MPTVISVLLAFDDDGWAEGASEDSQCCSISYAIPALLMLECTSKLCNNLITVRDDDLTMDGGQSAGRLDNHREWSRRICGCGLLLLRAIIVTSEQSLVANHNTSGFTGRCQWIITNGTNPCDHHKLQSAAQLIIDFPEMRINRSADDYYKEQELEMKINWKED